MTMLDTRRVPMNELGHESESPATAMLTSGAAMTQTRGAFTTAMAVQRPRNLRDVMRRIEDEADIAGEDFFYGWGAGDQRIEGPSIEAALAVARCYGNCAIEQMPMVETPTAYVFTAAFVDFETGFTLSRQFRQSKAWKVHGKHDEERKADIRFQIGQSKAIRNVVNNALKPMVNKAVERAKNGVLKKVEKWIAEKGIVKAIESMMKALAKHGISEKRVLYKLGLADSKAIGAQELVTLHGDLSALDAGRDWPTVLFPDPDTVVEAAPSGGAAALNAKLSDQKPAAKEPLTDEEAEPAAAVEPAADKKDAKAPRVLKTTTDAIDGFCAKIATDHKCELGDARKAFIAWLGSLGQEMHELNDAAERKAVLAAAEKVDWTDYLNK